MKRLHLALYLSCRESLRMHAERERRNAKIGLFVRGLFHAVFVAMPAAAGRKLKRSGDLAVACLPEVNVEPAHAQVGRLTSEPPFEAARRAFEASAPAASSRNRTGAPPAAAEPTQVRAAE